MNSRIQAYIAGNTPFHRCDARVKVSLLFAYSIAIFFASSWWQMAFFAAVVAIAVVVIRIPPERLVLPLVPVVLLAAFAVLFAFASTPTLEGFSQGALVAVRMVVLVAASLVVCFTTHSTALLRAFSWFVSPLRAVRVPVDDISVTLSLALRFVPVVMGELMTVRAAQRARGADLHGLSFSRKLRIWGVAFTAVFVGLFRHADALATAMDARCYGATEHRTSL